MGDGRLAALMMHNRFGAWRAVNDHMISGNGKRSFGPCDAVRNSCNDDCGFGVSRGNVSRSAWVNYTGRSDRYRSSYAGYTNSDWRLSMEGIQTGADLFRTKNTQFGVLFGYEGGWNRIDLDRIKAEDTFGGFYVARVLRGGADVRGVVAFGRQKYDMNRFDDLDGVMYNSSFKGRTSEVNLELGKRLSSGAWSVRPVAGLDIYTNDLRAAVETGAGIYAMAYDKTNLTQVFARFGSDLRYQVRNFTFDSGLYFSYDMNGQALKTGVSGTGDLSGLNPTLYGTKLGREKLTFNLGSTVQVTRNFALFGGYNGEYVADRANSRVQSAGYFGGKVNW